jgi:hypothetical protein
MVCVACGGADQRCCGGGPGGGPGGGRARCSTGLGCIGGGGPDAVAMCEPCGAQGHACCGEGPKATCNAGLACGTVPSLGVICVMP